MKFFSCHIGFQCNLLRPFQCLCFERDVAAANSLMEAGKKDCERNAPNRKGYTHRSGKLGCSGRSPLGSPCLALPCLAFRDVTPKWGWCVAAHSLALA